MLTRLSLLDTDDVYDVFVIAGVVFPTTQTCCVHSKVKLNILMNMYVSNVDDDDEDEDPNNLSYFLIIA